MSYLKAMLCLKLGYQAVPFITQEKTQIIFEYLLKNL